MGAAEKPLAGKRIVVTRAAEQAGELAAALETLGGEVLSLPTILVVPPTDWGSLDEQLRKLTTFDAVLFLSRNAVRYVAQRSRELGVQWELADSARPFVATVGAATREAAVSEGLRVDYVAKGETAELLAHELRRRLAGRTVLLPRGDRGDDRLPIMLREAGAGVTEVVAYRTICPELDRHILGRFRDSDVDAIIFSSPSTFYNLSQAIPIDELARLSKSVRFAAIGPTTARALRESGVTVSIEAAQPSSEGLAIAIAGYFASAVRCS